MILLPWHRVDLSQLTGFRVYNINEFGIVRQQRRNPLTTALSEAPLLYPWMLWGIKDLRIDLQIKFNYLNHSLF